MTYYGKSGKVYGLESQPFATGGEGKIHKIVTDPDKVAKLYKDPDNREQKLKVMVDNPPSEEQLMQIAWPLDVLYDGGGRFVGFVMYKLNISEDLNVIYEYGPTAKYSSLPWRSKILMARNLCAVVGAVHDAGHVIGDFNPKNISVNPMLGRITLLDTDSYHIQDGKYRCTVAMPDYVPRDIQKKMKKYGLADAPLPTFTQDSDNFSLAIHIFQLLMNGVHPFASALLPGSHAESVPLPSESILRGECVFFRKERDKTVPRFAPSIKMLPRKMRSMFKRAFLSKKPPEAEQWYNELHKLERSLVTCKKFPHHQYCKSFRHCPWCAADARFSGTIKVVKKKIAHERAEKEKQKVKTQKRSEERMIRREERRMNGGRRLSNETRDAILWLIAFGVLGAALFIYTTFF